MRVHHLREADYRRQRWKNGGGWTTELAVGGDAGRLRLARQHRRDRKRRPVLGFSAMRPPHRAARRLRHAPRIRLGAAGVARAAPAVRSLRRRMEDLRRADRRPRPRLQPDFAPRSRARRSAAPAARRHDGLPARSRGPPGSSMSPRATRPSSTRAAKPRSRHASRCCWNPTGRRRTASSTAAASSS